MNFSLPADLHGGHAHCALSWMSMTGPHDPMAASGRGGKSRGALRYFFLFALQTTGTAILLWYAVPLVRQVLLDPGSHVPRPENLVWSLSAITLMQTGYWIGRRLRQSLPQLRSTFVGHILLFVARMSFVLATSVFGFVFIVRRPEFQIPTSRYLALVIGLFALFCYTQELEQLGRALIGPWTKYKEPLSNLVYVIFTKLAGESVTPAILRFQ